MQQLKYSGVTDPLLEAAIDDIIGTGRLAPERAGYVDILPGEFYHRQTYAAAGQGSLTFWSNAQAQPIISNWPSAGLPSAKPFVLMGLRFCYDPLDSAGARISNQVGLAASASPITNGEELRTIFAGGIVDFSVLNQKKVDGVFGLNRFPQGAGSSFDVASATTATTTTYNAASFTNGVPMKGNEWRFPVPMVIGPNTTISSTVTWPTVLSVTAAFTLRAEMFGVVLLRSMQN